MTQSGMFATLAVALVLVASAQATADPGYQCLRTCKFAFCGYGRTQPRDIFNLPASPDQPFTPAICDKRGRFTIGSVDSTGEAYVQTEDGNVLISKYAPSGLLQNFSPSFFKSLLFDGGIQRSGVGHEVAQQNQLDFLDKKCIILPLTAYQIVDPVSGNVLDNVHPTGAPFYDCVSFTTYVE